MKSLAILLAGLALTGCATLPSGKSDPRDPWERMNRTTHAFNDAVDRTIGKPAAKAYVKVMPRFVRTGISNVFNNLNTLNTIVNDVLQGKMHQAGNDSARFLLNTTFGIGGLYDAASKAGLEFNDEDFGQTFGKWGMKPGPYLVLPFLGPSTARDTFGKLADQFTYPVTYLEDDSTRIWIRLVSLLDTRAELLDLDEQIDRSYDRYAFIRNAWLQRREFQVTDGNVEDPSLELEQDMDQDTGAEPPPEGAPEQPPEETPPGDAAAPDAPPAASPPEAAPATPPNPQEAPPEAPPRS
jgi:phospholipid-binding lipoprotein MlaA